MSIDKATLIQSGNSITDGGGGWLIGNLQATDTRRRRQAVLVKYGIHLAGEVCAGPFKKQPGKVTVSILVEGGPFVHWFQNEPYREKQAEKIPFSDGTTEDVRVLEKIGDYLIYEPSALHKWKALGKSVVITMQFPTEKWFAEAIAKTQEPFPVAPSEVDRRSAQTPLNDIQE